jgi:cell division protein YceG involved in septum cleavage
VKKQMKKALTICLALILVISVTLVAVAAKKEMYSLKGPVLSVDAAAKTVTVHSVEGVKAAADNRWKGDVTFATNDMTKIRMHKEKKTFDDLKAGQNVQVKFHEIDGKNIAVEIMIMPEKKTK